MSDNSAPLLSVKGVTLRFGGVVALDNVAFDVMPGQIAGLIGPNGAGKSTTFNCVSGFYPLSAGRVTFLGDNISNMNTAQVCHKGLVRTFQHDSLLSDMTVYDNILIATFSMLRSKSERVKRVEETAAILNLSDYLQEIAGNLPHGEHRDRLCNASKTVVPG